MKSIYHFGRKALMLVSVDTTKAIEQQGAQLPVTAAPLCLYMIVILRFPINKRIDHSGNNLAILFIAKLN